MPDLSIDTALRIFALLATFGLVPWLAHRLDCRESRRIKEAQRLADIERAEEDARRLAHAKSILHHGPARQRFENDEEFLRRCAISKFQHMAIHSHGPYVIPPASMSEPPHMPSISTDDSDDRAAAVITTLCMPADVATTPATGEH